MSTSYGPAPRSRAGCIALAVIGLVLACGGGTLIGSAVTRSAADGRGATVSTATPGETATKRMPASAAAPAPAPTKTIDDGVWTVGVDVPTGTYRTTANVGSRCYWQISKTGGDGVSDIISNDIPGGGRPQVTLKKGQDFKTDNCGTWVKR